MGYAVLGFIACEIAFFTECRPFHEYWSVPAKKSEHPSNLWHLDKDLTLSIGTADCWAYFSFQVVVGVFNITSDIVVLCVAIPLILQLYLPVQQKIALTTVFGMGIFVVAASILNKVFSLAPKLMNYTYLSWYYREAAVGLYVVNLPTLWVLLRRTFPSVSLWGYRSRSSRKELSSGLRLPSFGHQPSRDDTERLRPPIESRRWDIEDGLSSRSPINSVETVIHGGKT